MPGDGQTAVVNPAAPARAINEDVGAGNVSVAGQQVVGARIVGWGASTGGARGAVAAGTATLAQTAAALAQLLEDLKTHGVLGA